MTRRAALSNVVRPGIPARLLAGLLAALLAAIVVAAQPDPGAWDDDRMRRLEALDPADPMAYFELGEEIADRAETDADRRLARELFARAGALDPDGLARSACLALLDQIDPERESVTYRRLAALASLYGGRTLGPGTAGPDAMSSGEPDPSAALAVTEAFSRYRQGDGAGALSALEPPAVRALFDRCGTLLPGGSRRFLEDCRHYRGTLRPSLSSLDLERMLRLDVALLAGVDRPWSSEIVLNQGRPLVEVDPARPADAFDVDPARVYYRAGAWVTADEKE